MFVQYKGEIQLSFIHFVQSLLMLGRGGLVKEAIIRKSGKMTENVNSAKVETFIVHGYHVQRRFSRDFR